MKCCTVCKLIKALSEFGRAVRNRDLLQSRCKVCKNKYNRAFAKKNYKPKVRRPGIPANEYKKLNPHIFAAAQANRRAAKKNRTPKWLSSEQKQEIKEIYKIAKEIQWLSSEQLQVDHIIPLQGKNVSGLHVPWNLQILPKSQNTRKSNRV